MEVLFFMAVVIIGITLYVSVIFIITQLHTKYQTGAFIISSFVVSIFSLMFILDYVEKETGKNKTIRTFHRIEPKVEQVVIRTDDTVYVDSVYIYKVK
jgi:membrane protein implicated in regulation of membrane protease activity